MQYVRNTIPIQYTMPRSKYNVNISPEETFCCFCSASQMVEGE